MNDREVVVIGLGLVTPLGITVEENWNGLRDLKTGIGQHRNGAVPNWLRYYGKVGTCEFPQVPPAIAAQTKFLNRGAVLGVRAAHEAMKPAEPFIEAVTPARRALYIASGDLSKIGYEFLYGATGEQATSEWQDVDLPRLQLSALNKVNPFFLLESIANNLFSFLSACYSLMGPNTGLASLSPYGSQALELAYRAIQEGRADLALAVGYGNWIDEIPLYELEGLGLLSKCHSGAFSFRPFDRFRDGFIPGEGGAAICVAAAELADEKGLKVLARIKGCGNSIELSNGGGLSVPENVTQRSMRMALAESESAITDLGFIIAHGSATQKGDRSELRSVLETKGAESACIRLCALKPYTGHMGAASDLAEIIFGIEATKAGFVPATLNFGEAEKEFAPLAIASVHQPCTRPSFLSVSYGLGGQSSALVVSLAQPSVGP